MSRPPTKPAPTYTLAQASRAANRIRDLRAEAHDPDLTAAFPLFVDDDQGVDAAVEYVLGHRRVSALVRGAELPELSLLIEYQRQRDTRHYERRTNALLQAGHTLGIPPVTYGEPMGLRTKQAVYHRRNSVARKRASHRERVPADESRAREWLDEHADELRNLADALIDHRDKLLDLVDGLARSELLRSIDAAGTQMNSRRPSIELCGALAMAVYLLRPSVARPPANPDLRSRLDSGLRLLW